jgi:hypothetical protein
VIDPRSQLLRAALGFAGCSMVSYDRALWALRTWLDSWSGIGHVSVGMARQGYDLQLTRYDEKGWRATFYTTGMEHSPASATGTGWERTPWHEMNMEEQWLTTRAAWRFCSPGTSRWSAAPSAPSILFLTAKARVEYRAGAKGWTSEKCWEARGVEITK